jgi:hypothetical protein
LKKSSNKETQGHTEKKNRSALAATESVAPSKNESVKAPAAINTDRRIELDKLANAVEKSSAKTVAKMFDGVSEAERSRVRTALLEIHGIFGWNKAKIKPSAKKKYSAAECKKKCGGYFDCFVRVAVGGPRDHLDYAIPRALSLWPKETCKVLRDRPAEWLTKYLKGSVEFDSYEQWMLLVSEGVYPPELDEAGIRALIQSFYHDATAVKIKKVFRKLPWVSDIVYGVYTFENFMIDTNHSVSWQPGFLAFIDFLADQKALDRVKLINAVLSGMCLVPKAKHVGACLQILEYIEPSVSEWAANQGELCAALSIVPLGHVYLLEQLERCCSSKGFDATSVCLAIATILPEASIVAARQACITLVAIGQHQLYRSAAASSLGQSLIHKKREIAELGLSSLSSLYSSQDKVAVNVVNSVLPHCSHLIKKQIHAWLSGQAEPPKLETVKKADKPKSDSVSKGENAIPKKARQYSAPLKRSRETIKQFRAQLPIFAASVTLESHLRMNHYRRINPKLWAPMTSDLFGQLISLHFGLPRAQKAQDILALMKNCNHVKSGDYWWGDWSNSFTAAVVFDDREYAQKLANWINFTRGEACYSLENTTPGIYYLTILLTNPFRREKLVLTKAMQMVLEKDSKAECWLVAYRAFEASQEDEFIKCFEIATRKYVQQYEACMKTLRSYKATPVSEFGTLLWHAAKRKGMDVNRLGCESMAVIMTLHSLLDASEPDPSDTLPLPVPVNRLSDHIGKVAELFSACNIKYAITTPYTERNPDEVKVIRRQLVTDLSEETFQKLNQAHDPFQFSLSRIARESVRAYEVPVLFDIKNTCGLNHVQLPKDAIEKVLSMATPVKQNGIVVPTVCNEHTVALACPILEKWKSMQPSHWIGLDPSRRHHNQYKEYRQWTVAKTKANHFDWDVAQQLASQIPDADEMLESIQKI